MRAPDGSPPVPCAPCLSARIMGHPENTHGCHGVTRLRLDDLRLRLRPVGRRCPCSCGQGGGHEVNPGGPDPTASRMRITTYRVGSDGERIGERHLTVVTVGDPVLIAPPMAWPPCRCPRCGKGDGGGGE